MDDTELARGRRSSCRMALPARSKRTANATRRRPPDGETLLLAGSLLPAITPPRTALAIRQGTRRAGAKRLAAVRNARATLLGDGLGPALYSPNHPSRPIATHPSRRRPRADQDPRYLSLSHCLESEVQISSLPSCKKVESPSREVGVASVVGAGFALPRDAGRRPPPGELAGAPRRPRASAEGATLLRAYNKKEPRGRMAPGFPFDFGSDGFQETQVLTSPRT